MASESFNEAGAIKPRKTGVRPEDAMSTIKLQ